jgi:hypothetical protein
MFSVTFRGAQACGQVLADAAVRPAQPIQSWLASLAEHLARYDNQVVSDALRERGWTSKCPIFVVFLCVYAHSTVMACLG